MKKILLSSVLFILFSMYISAQDVDVFKRDLNDHFSIPQITDSMSFDEFETLSTNFRLMDAMEAIVVPGLIHFKLKDNTTGWVLVGTRLVGYTGWIYASINKDGIWTDVFNYKILNSEESKSDYYVALASVSLVVASYLYDWIHGRSLLEKKQQKIRFKYAVKLRKDVSVVPFNYKSTVYPEFAIQFHF